MNFLIVVGGVIAGIFLYSSHERFLIGSLLGGALAVLLTNILSLREKVRQLEGRLEKLRRATPDASPTVVMGKTVRQPLAPAAKRATPPSRPLPELELEFDTEPTTPAPKVAASPPDRTATQPKPAHQMRSPARPISQPAPAARQSRSVQAEKPADAPLELWDIVVSYFTGGNVVVRVGVLVLFFGVAFLMKYSIEKNLVPIELRLAGIYLGGLALVIFGWRLRNSREVYALILQGGGIGILYLTTFGAMKLYHLVPFSLALFLMIGLSLFSAVLAITQDARSLAVIGITGGFLAPVLTSTGTGSHVMLFSYYALLNGGILFTAWHKSWRELNLVGFVFTFAVGALWGNRSYQPELFATTEPFLILFFLYYLSIGVLFARNQPLSHKGYIDCTMVFGTPLVSFAIQTALVRPYEYGIAWSALGLGLVYALTAWLIFRRGSAAMRTLIESFMALGVVFGTIAIPLALDGRWTSAAWALEGSAIVWIAIRQHRDLARVFGLLLQLGAGLAFLSAVDDPTGVFPLFNGFYLGALAVSLAGLCTAFCLSRQVDEIDSARQESVLALTWGLLWWFGSGLHEIHSFVPHHYRLALALIFISCSSLGYFLAGRRLFWNDLCQVYKLLPPVLTAGALYSLVEYRSHPAIYGGWLAWPLAFGLNWLLLYNDDREEQAQLLPGLHLLSFLLLIALCTREGWWWAHHALQGAGVWAQVTVGVIPALFVYATCRFRAGISWPVGAYQSTYLYHALAPVSFFLWAGSIYANLTSAGDPYPLPYLPLLNPLDLAQCFVLGVLIYWSLVVRSELALDPFGLGLRNLAITAGTTVFFWLNCVLLRTIHHWGGVPLHTRTLLASDLVQTSLSIFWTLTAFGVMYFAAHRTWRPLWLVGAALVGVVVVKLFMFDLANTDTVERIISFIGVGVICLIIGYLAPLPQEPQPEVAGE